MEATERKPYKRWYLTDEEKEQLKKFEDRYGYAEFCKRAKMIPSTFYRILKVGRARQATIKKMRKVLDKAFEPEK